MSNVDDRALCEQEAAAALNAANCPAALISERVPLLADYLVAVEEELPDPRPGHPPLSHRVVRVRARDGGIRQKPGGGTTRPVTTLEVLQEVVAGQDHLNARTHRDVGRHLRWRPFGAAL